MIIPLWQQNIIYTKKSHRIKLEKKRKLYLCFGEGSPLQKNCLESGIISIIIIIIIIVIITTEINFQVRHEPSMKHPWTLLHLPRVVSIPKLLTVLRNKYWGQQEFYYLFPWVRVFKEFFILSPCSYSQVLNDK